MAFLELKIPASSLEKNYLNTYKKSLFPYSMLRLLWQENWRTTKYRIYWTISQWVVSALIVWSITSLKCSKQLWLSIGEFLTSCSHELKSLAGKSPSAPVELWPFQNQIFSQQWSIIPFALGMRISPCHINVKTDLFQILVHWDFNWTNNSYAPFTVFKRKHANF